MNKYETREYSLGLGECQIIPAFSRVAVRFNTLEHFQIILFPVWFYNLFVF